MIATFWLAGALVCAQPAPTPIPIAAGRITDVTVYQGQAMVTREVAVPAGAGTIELVVAPLPERTVDGSLFAEASDGVRVLSTRYRTRAVRETARPEVRELEARVAKLAADSERMRKEISVQQEDLRYVQKLEGFTGTSLNSLTEKGRLDSEAILALSRFVMETRSEKTKAATDLEQQLQANAGASGLARERLVELSAGSTRTERDAVIVVERTRPAAGAVRLGYLVDTASWSPQYRLRGSADPAAPVRLEYLAAVTQQTGEPWNDVRVTLSNARPSLDAAPPEIRPLELAVGGDVDEGPIEAKDDRSRSIAVALARPIALSFANETPLEEVVKYIRAATTSPAFPQGLPIYVDPIGLQEAERSLKSTVAIDVAQVPLRTSLRLALKQIGLTYRVRDGLLTITAIDDEDAQDQTVAIGQAEELGVAEGPDPSPTAPGKIGTSVTFPIAGRLDIPSRRDPQWLQVARVELPAEYYARAVPVISSQVYRLARLTNKNDLVLLPGEATVHVGGDFVGRMRMPLVAAGEPFVAGFGADPQLQVARRLVHKSRTIQGGNQVLDYEFRIGLRNYHPTPIKVELWDRLPKPRGEAVAVNLVKTSADLSTDPLYLRTARLDNLLRWDINVPKGTIGDKTIYLHYEFRLEYARDLSPPHFVSGGLREKPIGGAAMGTGMMGGGMRSINPRGY